MSLKVPSNLYNIVNCNCSINVSLEKNHFGIKASFFLLKTMPFSLQMSLLYD